VTDPAPTAPDGDLRLRELTEQTLHLLDELATARRQAELAETERRRIHHAYNVLSERLADVQARLRASSEVRIVLGAHAEPDGDACETYICVDDTIDGPARDRWLAALRRFLERTPATLVVPRDRRPAEGVLAILSGIRVLESESGRPSAVWNLALATARAPIVLVVGPGAVPSGVRPADFGMLDDPKVAVVQPVLRLGREGPEVLGLQGDARLRLRPRRRPPGAGDDLEDLEFAHPALFAIRQQAVTELGPFDQDLASDLALAEFCLRARAAGLRIVGVPPLSGDLQRAAPRERRPLQRDHLVVLARHRPRDLPAALAESTELWLMPDAERDETIGALLRRLPGANDWPASVEVTLRAISALARETVPWTVWRQHLDEIATALGGPLAEEAEPASGDSTPAALARAVAALSAKARALTAGRELMERAQALAEANRALEARLAAAEQRERDVGEACASLQHSLAVHDRLRVEAEGRAAELSASVEGMRGELASARAAAETANQSLQALRISLRVAGRISGDATDAQLIDTITNLRGTLVSRDAWLASLLREKARRRLRLRPYLDAAEQRFLAEHGGSSGDPAGG